MGKNLKRINDTMRKVKPGMSRKQSQNPLNIKKAMKIFDDDFVLYKEVLNQFIKEFPMYMDEILDTINNQDYNSFVFKVHKIKGMLLNLGAEKAYKFACMLEKEKVGENFENIKGVYENLKRELISIRIFFLKKEFNEKRE